MANQKYTTEKFNQPGTFNYFIGGLDDGPEYGTVMFRTKATCDLVVKALNFHDDYRKLMRKVSNLQSWIKEFTGRWEDE